MATKPKSTVMRIVKIGQCPSLTGKSNLTYHLGCDAKSELYIRIWGNDGGGLFGTEWVAWSRIEPVLETEEPIVSKTLRPLFKGRSANTPGFVLAVLRAEGVIERIEGHLSGHGKADPTAFLRHADSDADLKVPGERR